tara:strand:+ start:489 stop:776 length:288 start_codon:yes stop_codon:yes gene_type:complete
MTKLKRIGNNIVEVQTNNVKMLFSYETCVALEITNCSYYTEGSYYPIVVDENPVWGNESGISKTTHRHIKKWLEDRNFTYITHEKFVDTLDALHD